MDRLFRDWRFALLWVIGISAMAAASFSEGSHPDQPLAQVPSKQAPRAAYLQPSPPIRDTAEDKSPAFGEPVMDTTPFDPSPADPAQSPTAAATAAAESGAPGVDQPNAPATATP